MGRDLGAEIDNLPPKEREAVRQRADEIRAEIATLKELRKLAAKSQVDVARSLGTTQPAISRMEQGTDMFLSTLRGYVESLGGELDLVVRLPGKPEVRVDCLASLHDEADSDAPEQSPQRRAASSGGTP